jgi:hypothetical protein
MRKKTSFLLIVLICFCIAGFLAYKAKERILTDTTPPQITLSSETPRVSVHDPRSALLAGVSATDKRDGNVTDSLVVESITLLDKTGHFTVSYAAFDKSGNVAKAQQEAVFTDYTSPRFSLDQPLLFRSGLSFDVLNILDVEDAVDGNLQHRIRATALDTDTITTIGTHTVQFQVTNSLGDTSTLVLPVEIYEINAFDASLTLTDYLVYLPVGADFNAAAYLDAFTYQKKSTNLRSYLPSNFSLETEGTVQTGTPGVYTVGYYVTYTDENVNNPNLPRKHVGYSKLIVVVEG